MELVAMAGYKAEVPLAVEKCLVVYHNKHVFCC
jgi:hypothetical protein